MINRTSKKNEIFEMPENENCGTNLLYKLQNFEDFED